MGTVLNVLGFLGVIVFIILLIIRVIRRKPVKPILIGLIICFACVVLGVGLPGNTAEPETQTNEPGGVSTPTQHIILSAETTTPESTADPNVNPNTIRVGESVDVDGVSVTFLNLIESEGKEFVSPADGNIFILFEIEIVNDSDEELAVSSLLLFDAYCDEYSTSLSLTAHMAEDGLASLDGKIAPGKRMRGAVGYEVPSDWSTMELNFEPSIWGRDRITLVAEKGD